MKLINYITIVSLLIGAASCEDVRFGDAFLEKPAGSDDNIDLVFSCKEYAEQALVAAYKTLPDGLIMPSQNLTGDLLESLTDLNNGTKGYGPIRNVFYPGQLTAATQGNFQKYNFSNGGGWESIRRAWIFIENVDRVPDMTQQEKEVRKAEAKMIIAIQYADMFRHFGGLPKIDRSYSPNEQVELPRMTVEENVKFITDLLDEAAKVLPWTVSSDNDGRMTKAGAMGLKVRVLLFAASPIFNADVPYTNSEATEKHYLWYGNKSDERWNDVINAANAFLEELNVNGGYKLVNTGNPREDFRCAYFERGNGEVLISTRKQAKYENNAWVPETFFEQCNYGIGNTTLDYVEMFPMKNGEDFDWNNPEHAAYPFFDAQGEPVRDPRLYETVLINGDAYQGRTVETWIGGRERPQAVYEKKLAASGFAIRKFRQDINTSKGKFYSWPHLRLPEIYLSLAEALNEVGRTSEAYEYTRLVRERLGMPNIKSGLGKEEFREQILRERALEFGYEEVRFFDLVRWKRDDIFRKKLRGLDIKSADQGVTCTYHPFELTQNRAWQGNGWNVKWYFSPFPVEEINKDYGLVQNPGW